MSTTSRTDAIEALRAAAQGMSRPSTLMRSLIAARAGLNTTDAECIDYLMHAGTASATDLVKATGLTKSTVSSIVVRLEQAGYIDRQTNPIDKRRILLRPKMQLIGRHFGPYYAAVTLGFQDIVSGYTEEEIAVITEHYAHMTALYERQVKLLSDPAYKGIE